MEVAKQTIFKIKMSLFLVFFTLCPFSTHIPSRRTTAQSLRSDLHIVMKHAFDLANSTFLVTFVRYTILTWMKVLIVNTSESTGGAAVAAHRLMDALCANGVEAAMLVRNRSTSDPRVYAPNSRWWLKWCFLWERLVIFFHLRFSRKGLFAVDIANAGTDITSRPEFKAADVIHLHWVNQGWLSLKGLQRILQSGKRVVWTMHDLWPVSSICHYAEDCVGFHNECGHCPLLPQPARNDLSHQVWQRKAKVYRQGHITFVTCSRWLGEQAQMARLSQGHKVVSIPNAIDTTVFHPRNRSEARQKLGLPTNPELKIVLFVAQQITNVRKGGPYLIEAFQKLLAAHPHYRSNTALLILGGAAEQYTSAFDIPVFPVGYTEDVDRIVQIYNAADLFVIPSVSDNLPNTIMEALACGVPCVGFAAGGIPEMIDHHTNGYVARAQDTQDLAEGLHWVLQADAAVLQRAALEKVHRCYSQQSVAQQYLAIYQGKELE